MTALSLANRLASYGSSLVILNRVLYSRSIRVVQSFAGSTVARKEAGRRLIWARQRCVLPVSSSSFSLFGRREDSDDGRFGSRHCWRRRV